MLKLDIDAYRDIGARVASLGVPTVVVQEGGYMVQALSLIHIYSDLKTTWIDISL